MAGYYNKDIDYSKELQRTDLSSSERDRLTQERQNKIDAVYGGKEPNMRDSDKTYSQTYGGSSGSSSGSSKGSSSSASKLPNNTNTAPSASRQPGTTQTPTLNQYGYRDGFDYSEALSNRNLSAEERAQLTAERQNKIKQQYGGVEPNMTGSNQKFSQTSQGQQSNRYTYNGLEYNQQTGAGVYGAPTIDSDVKNYTQGGVTYRSGPSMARVTDPNIIRNGYYISNGYTVFVDQDGYATKAIKGVADYTPHLDINAGNGSYNTAGAWTDNEMLSAADRQKIADIRRQLQAGQITGDQANAAANAIRAGYGYSIDKSGYVTDNGALSGVNDLRTRLGLSTNPEGGSTAYYRYLMGTDTSPTAQAAGSVKSYPTFAGENGYASPTYPSGTNGNVPTSTTTPLPGNSASDLDWSQIGISGGSGSGSLNPGVADAYNPGSMNNYLDQWYKDAQEQQKNTIDFGTSQSVNDLLRAQQDAEAQYQAQRNQIAIDEAKAKDNQALYAEARGDKGGIGAAQYDAIMNTAAQNRLSVNSAQTKLATDTARQIADLRAQGEYEKADAMLQLSQQYLSQLMSLEQWSMEYNLSVAQFNASLQQWQKEYDLKVADLLGSYNGQQTLSAKQFEFNKQQYQDELVANQDSKLASAGETLLAAGIMPSASQLKAMGMTQNDAQNYITALKVQQVAKSKGGSGSGSGSGSDSGSGSGSGGVEDYDGLMLAAEASGHPESYIANHYKEYGFNSKTGLDFKAWQKEQDGMAYNNSYFNAAMTNIRTSLDRGEFEKSETERKKFEAGLTSLWVKLNARQKARMQNLLAEYGVAYKGD